MHRPLLINGFMATGKSAVARAVSERTGRPWVDLDARIEQRAGTTIADIFATRGEDAFRQLEREELLRVLGPSRQEFALAPVCALGGGALLDRRTRLEALRGAVVVTLEASLPRLLKRALADGGRPLLDTEAPEKAMERLLGQRTLAYREANATLSTDDRSIESIAEAVIDIWRRNSVAVAAGERSYTVEIGADLVSTTVPALVAGASGTLTVTDETVHGLYGADLEAALPSDVPRSRVVLAPGEQHKQLASVREIYECALRHSLDRRGKMLGLGGGVITDMTGFAAASWLRGVQWVAVPTTLLAMVDASVGGKTGVDFGPAKNAVGAFWQPGGVVCDVSFLGSETERAYRGALAEVVKTALIGDSELFDLLEGAPERVLARDREVVSEMVRRSVLLKAWVVGNDEREAGLRATLNLGHTVGHALEAQGGYTRLTHGEAVSLGLVAALRIGARLGRTPQTLVARTVALLARLGLPTEVDSEPLSEAAKLLGHDKKRSGAQIRFILAEDVGRVDIVPLALEELTGHVLALRPR